MEHDQIRTDILEQYGLSVIRFSNADIDRCFSEVCNVIEEKVMQRIEVLPMANINPNELTREQIENAMTCETAEDLMALAKEEGVELTKEEADIRAA